MRRVARAVGERLALLGLGTVFALVLLAAAELTLRFLDVGGGPRKQDPFVGFSSLVPMFELTVREDGARVYRTAEARGAPIAAEFLAEKPAEAFRVFVVGGSSAAGTPYDYRNAFSGWLARRIEAELPHLHTEVVNASINAYASRRVLAVVRELARYQPDLLIVYCGHNELAESRYYSHLTGLDPRLFRLWTWLAGTRTYATLASSPPLRRASEWFHAQPVDFVDQLNTLEYFALANQRYDGLLATKREVEYRELHYRHNVEAMIESARQAGSDVMLLTLSQNFADWRPGVSSHRLDLADDAQREWEALVAEGDALLGTDGNCEEALLSYRRALAMDDEYADLHFKIARCEERLGHDEAAFRHYRLASDLDRVPHGAPTRYNGILRELASKHGTLVVDIETLFAERSPHRLVGDNLFVDLLHPNLRGHQLIAEAVAGVLQASGIPEVADRWRGEYACPEAETLYVDDPSLRVREWKLRAVACSLARRRECALESAAAVLAVEPEHLATIRARDSALKLPAAEDALSESRSGARGAD